MADLPEKKKWEGVYQWETSDRALGGPGGVMNKPLLNLTNRTAYLKTEIEKENRSLTEHINATDPHSQYVLKKTVATESVAGITKLSSATDSNSTTIAATSAAVNSVKELIKPAVSAAGGQYNHHYRFKSMRLDADKMHKYAAILTVNTANDGNDYGDAHTHIGYNSGTEDAPEYNHYFRGTGATHINTLAGLFVSGTVDVADRFTARGDIEMTGNGRKHFIIRNTDGTTRAVIYKDYTGDGLYIYNDDGAAGAFAFKNNGDFIAPRDVATGAGSARLHVDGNISGPAWGTNLSDHLLSIILPVGVPIPWPGSTPPPGWLKCNGWSFDKVAYPRLAKAYPSGILPDLRGEFIRGWDDGRGVDTGRAIGGWQNHDIDAHSHTMTLHAYSRSKTTNNHGWGSDDVATGPFTNNTAPTGGNETRPRNIAFLYIVRAA